MRRGCLVVAAAVLALAGCGSQSKSAGQTSTSGSSTPSGTSGATTATSASPTDCNTLGINPTGMREGTCTHAGVTYVIVNENHLLKLPTLSARLKAVHAPATLSGAPAAQGKFIVASLTITNRLELPQSFDRSGTQQAGLILTGSVYKEDAGAEKSADPAACVHSAAQIAPGKSVTCDVVFAVPAGSAAQLGAHGAGDLYVVDFGSDLAGSISPQKVGQIRLYR